MYIRNTINWALYGSISEVNLKACCTAHIAVIIIWLHTVTVNVMSFSMVAHLVQTESIRESIGNKILFPVTGRCRHLAGFEHTLI